MECHSLLQDLQSKTGLAALEAAGGIAKNATS